MYTNTTNILSARYPSYKIPKTYEFVGIKIPKLTLPISSM